MNMVRNGILMMALLVVMLFGSAAEGATAAKPACRAIEGIGERLACYDASYPPAVKKPALVDDAAARGPYKDPFLAEEARTAAKLKNICRGC